jgi:putative flippase GtrA
VPVEPSTRGRLTTTWQRAVRELSAFGVVGIVCFLVDLGVFQLLYAHAGVGAVTSRLISTLISMTLAYVGHRYWSFADRQRTTVRREYVLFLAINGVTLVLGLAITAFARYGLDQDSSLALQVANVFSIMLGTVIRYLAYRRWVFTAHPV